MIRSWAACMALLLASTASSAFELCDDGSHAEELHYTLARLRDVFDEKRFDELDARFHVLMGTTRAGAIADAELARAFRIFEVARAGSEPRHLEWIRAFPKSQPAYLALGYHHVARGFNMVAGNGKSRPLPSQTERMEEELRYALRAFDEADRLGPKSTLAAGQRIRIASLMKPLSADAAQLYRAAISADPKSLEVRIQFIRASRPAKGASLRPLEAIIKDASSLPASDQRYVRYLVLQEMGSALEAAGEDRAAAAKYEKSFPLCPGLDVSIDRLAEAYKRMRKYDSLLTTMDEVIRRHPRNGWAFATRGLAHREQRRYAKALDDYRQAMDLGNALGYEGVAWFYERGLVVPRDESKAIELYGLAAVNGLEGAAKSAEALRLRMPKGKV
jgi:tetratricopeptide (TPR) repeat protein